MILPYTFGGDGDTTITPEYIDDHAARALDRLAQEYKGKPNLTALLNAFNVQTQDIEDALYALLTQRGLGGAVGIQLDHLGEIVSQPRNGLSDEDYRIWLTAKIALNRSGGSTEDILNVFSLITAGATLQIRDEWPAAFTLVVAGVAVTSATAAILLQLLRLAKAGGVRALFEWRESNPADVFTFDGTPAQAFDVGKLAGAAV